jgi:hypothetical protein
VKFAEQSESDEKISSDHRPKTAIAGRFELIRNSYRKNKSAKSSPVAALLFPGDIP